MAVGTSQWDNEGCSSTTPTLIDKTTLTTDELRSNANSDFIRLFGVRKVTIDGVEVTGLPACDSTHPETCLSPYRVQSPVFSYTVPAHGNVLEAFYGACYDNPTHNGQPYTVRDAVVDGVFVMIKPLSVGHHTIRFGKLDATGTPNRLYNITVTDHELEHKGDHRRKPFG